jgi:hypothetical protein
MATFRARVNPLTESAAQVRAAVGDQEAVAIATAIQKALDPGAIAAPVAAAPAPDVDLNQPSWQDRLSDAASYVWSERQRPLTSPLRPFRPRRPLRSLSRPLRPRRTRPAGQAGRASWPGPLLSAQRHATTKVFRLQVGPFTTLASSARTQRRAKFSRTLRRARRTTPSSCRRRWPRGHKPFASRTPLRFRPQCRGRMKLPSSTLSSWPISAAIGHAGLSRT